MSEARHSSRILAKRNVCPRAQYGTLHKLQIKMIISLWIHRFENLILGGGGNYSALNCTQYYYGNINSNILDLY